MLAGVGSARSNASCRLLAEACSCPSAFVLESDKPDVSNAPPANEHKAEHKQLASRPDGSDPGPGPAAVRCPEDSPADICAGKSGNDAVRSP